MKISTYEFMKERVQNNPTEITIGRFAHHAIAALLKAEIDVRQFDDIASAHPDCQLVLDDPAGNMERTPFTLGDISMLHSSQVVPAEVFLSAKGATGPKFTFKLDEQGKPNFQVHAANACV